jgi:hypothetical protein
MITQLAQLPDLKQLKMFVELVKHYVLHLWGADFIQKHE